LSIPFENVDVLLGIHPGTELVDVFDKLVTRRRGGYCYEHTLLFAAVLERLGFRTERRMARIIAASGRVLPRTHAVQVVSVDGEDFQVDVGFGAGVLRPMPLRDGVEVDQSGFPHRLDRDGGQWVLSRRSAQGDWVPLHAHDGDPQYPSDFTVAHHYISTHADSPFVSRLVVIRPEAGLRRQLTGDQLTVEYADGRKETTAVPPEDLEGVLRGLDVVLSAEEYRRLAEIYV
jgi:N-hydroxyarylamine O-acetyltransferase